MNAPTSEQHRGRRSMNKKIWLVLLFLLVFLAVGLWWFWPFGNGRVLRLPGVVEIQEVRLGSKVGGRVYSVLVEEGKIVHSGDTLVVFEAPELQNQKLQLESKLASAK